MSVRFNRRQCLGFAATALALAACNGDAEQCAPGDGAASPSAGTPPNDVEEIATWILGADDRTLVAELRDRLVSGWTRDAVFAALLLVSARRSDSVFGGGGFHTVLEVEALRFFGQRAPSDWELVPLVFGLRFTRGVAANGWELPTLDEGRLPSAEGAAARLIRAIEAGDTEGAHLEVTALARAGDMRLLDDTLLEVGSRRAHTIGHEPICAAKVLRVLRELPGAWAEDVYRAMVHMFVEPKLPGTQPTYAEVWRANRERVREVPCSWLSGADDPEAVAAIVTDLRATADPSAAVRVVEARLSAGVSERSVWDGIVLAAADAVFAGANYHTITSVSALRDAALLATSVRVRLLLLLQGSVYVVITRPASFGAVPFLEARPVPATLDEIFESAGPGSVARALGYLADGDARAYVARSSELAASRTSDEHFYKVLHALLLEVERVPPAWHRHLLALNRLYAPRTSDQLCQAWLLGTA
jgi:hypothetical protein